MVVNTTNSSAPKERQAGEKREQPGSLWSLQHGGSNMRGPASVSWEDRAAAKNSPSDLHTFICAHQRLNIVICVHTIITNKD